MDRKHKDTFYSMTALYRSIPSAENYNILADDSRKSRVKLFAPHGGCIEPGTDQIVLELAGGRFDYFLFRGERRKGCFKTLHVTSTHFDDPVCTRLAQNASIAVSVHGCNVQGIVIEVGGGNIFMAEQLSAYLVSNGYHAVTSPHTRHGQQDNNFINKCRHGGVQLELSVGFRSTLFPGFPQVNQRHPQEFGNFVRIMREWLDTTEENILRQSSV